MKAAFLRAPEQFAVRDVPEPQVGPGDLLVEVQMCGVGGSDVQRATQLADDWERFGHEYGGRVVKVGEAVTKFRPGDAVVWSPAVACGRCRACRSGRTSKCRDQVRGRGIGCAERVADGEQMWVAAKGLRPIEMALAEPLTAAIHLVETGDIPVGGDVVVIGVGPVGLMATVIARRRGAAQVFVVDLSQYKTRLQRAEEFGAHAVIAADEQNVVEEVRTHAPDGVDSVLVSAPPGSLPLAIDLCAVGGTVALAEAADEGSEYVTLDANEIYSRNVRIEGASNRPVLRYLVALDMLQRGFIEAEKIYTHILPLDDVAEAFRTVQERPAEVIKAGLLVRP